ncbi:MAG TPA: methyltransferase domain-containing protein [Acidimicrobiales bacterium]|nr:methyltransferase domain-containing protein [Acidimicrobiales bacterium]
MSRRWRPSYERSRASARTEFDRLPNDEAVRLAYNILLRREPDPSGAAYYTQLLDDGAISRWTMVENLMSSPECQSVEFSDLLSSMHLSRNQFVRTLPKAARILDLGGTDQADEQGALVSLGYPYDFERLTVVDLPPDDRHDIYRAGVWKHTESKRGPVDYAHHSMTDLSAYDEGQFDLVYSGQSIEHVTEEEGEEVFEEVNRVLDRRGWFCLDTPNGPPWRLIGPELINPDHKIEYSHAQLSASLEKHGFEVVEAKGLNYVGTSIAEGVFDEREAARNIGLYDDPESCLHLAYKCRRVPT